VYRYVNGRQQTRPPLPLESTVVELVAAWEGLGGGPAPVAGSLAEAVREYLPTISARPSAKQARAHLAIMLEALGRDRRLTSVEPGEVDRLIQHWKVTPPIRREGRSAGRPTPPGRGVSDETIRKRLAHMQTFFKVMLPKGAINPVAACTQRPRPKKPETRGIPMIDVGRILAAMPDERQHGTRRAASLAKIRAAVSAYTGLDPAQIQSLTPGDVILDGAAPAYRVGRAKGDSVAIQVIPLTPAGVEAFRAFVEADAFGRYNPTGVNRAVKRAAASIGIPLGTFRAKDLRHSFLTELYRLTRDAATVARFALHSEGSPYTARYTRAAHEQVDRDAAAKFTTPAVRFRRASDTKVVHIMSTSHVRKR
jgi:integrase